MAVFDLSSVRATPALARPAELICIALAIAHAVYLAAAYWQGIWIVAPDGNGVESDFVNVWAAGKLALQGLGANAYDWPAHKAMEVVAVGHSFDGYFGWHYPPIFLFAAAPLALLPYSSAYILWLLATFLAYVCVVRAIVGDRSGYLLAAAFPAILSNFVVGQNGFLTAGLMGGALLLLNARPVIAGVLLGALTYKPHLGLLFPVVLAVTGHWRVFATAAITAAALAAASALVFGIETWLAFFPSISHTSQAFLTDGWANFGKLQTAFGLTRMLGGSEGLAWAVQIPVSAAVALGVVAIWRSRVDYEIKAAALGAGAMLATPYLYTYDLVVLAVPLAFLFRLARADGFLPGEPATIALACALIAAFPFVTAPVGFAAVLIVAGIVVRRALNAS
ncbi:MAG: glycosyltransferase family 87 protein [Pseudolabrys sp.]